MVSPRPVSKDPCRRFRDCGWLPAGGIIESLNVKYNRHRSQARLRSQTQHTLKSLHKSPTVTAPRMPRHRSTSRCGCGRTWRLTSRRWLALGRGSNGGLRALSRPCPRLSVRWRSTAVISRSRHEPIAAAEHPPPPSSSSPPQPSQIRDLAPPHGTWRMAPPSLAASSSSHSRNAGSRKLPCSGWAI
jgi:hypothetical protein